MHVRRHLFMRAIGLAELTLMPRTVRLLPGSVALDLRGSASHAQLSLARTCRDEGQIRSG
jgi:hypothetical protein